MGGFLGHKHRKNGRAGPDQHDTKYEKGNVAPSLRTSISLLVMIARISGPILVTSWPRISGEAWMHLSVAGAQQATRLQRTAG